MKNKIKSVSDIKEYFFVANRGEVYKMAIKGIDKALIEKALEYSSGNQVQAAQILGINRNTIRTKIKKNNINVSKFKS